MLYKILFYYLYTFFSPFKTYLKKSILANFPSGITYPSIKINVMNINHKN